MAGDEEREAALARLHVAGASGADLGWFDEIGWNPAGAAPIADDAQRGDYARREAVLNAAIAHLSFPERAASPEGRLAAELGARLADWRERGEEDDT